MQTAFYGSERDIELSRNILLRQIPEEKQV